MPASSFIHAVFGDFGEDALHAIDAIGFEVVRDPLDGVAIVLVLRRSKADLLEDLLDLTDRERSGRRDLGAQALGPETSVRSTFSSRS